MFGALYDIWQAWSKPDFIDRKGTHWIFDYHAMEWLKDDFTPNLVEPSETAQRHINTILSAAAERFAKPVKD